MKKLPLFVALDVARLDQALSLVEKTKNYVQAYKIGPRLFLIHGLELIEKIKNYGAQVFLDFKFHDIPSSTLEAVRTSFNIGADFVTVHASVGEETLELLSQFEKSALKDRFFQILFVTVLSSVQDSEENRSKVFQQAEWVCRAGLKGLVCSPWEVGVLKKKYPDMFLVTPGIRLEGDSSDDQKRWMSPLRALEEGSSALVMGRSLIKSEEPEQILKKLYASLC